MRGNVFDFSRRAKLGLWFLGAIALVATFACDGDSGSPTSPAPGGGEPAPPPPTVSGSLRLEMTDAPIDEVSQVVVWVSGLKIKPSGQSAQFIDANLGPYDLLQLQGITTILADADVAAGSFEFIEILLDESQSFVVEASTGERQPLDIASDKAKLHGPFEVVAGSRTTVLFDFDAERSLTLRGNGTWLLRPVLEVLEVTVTVSSS